MDIPAQLASHFRAVHTGGNWCCSDLRQQLDGLTWQQALQKPHGLNSIAALAYHIHYYIKAATGVLRGQPLTAKDQFSFDHPPIQNQADWEATLADLFDTAVSFAALIEDMAVQQLDADFTDAKYGSYLRNLLGILEHTHYHLGQIALLRRIVAD